MRYFIIIFLLILFCEKSLAQNHWQVSFSSGVISSRFLIKSPLGYQFEGRIFYNLSDSVLLSISSGFHNWKTTLGFGHEFKTIPLLAGIKQTFPSGIFSPYFAGELGVHFITRDYILQTYEPSGRFEGLYRLTSTTPETESVAKFAFRLSIGSAIALSNFWDIDLAIMYNNISYDFIYIYNPASLTSSGGISFYSFLVGLNYNL